MKNISAWILLIFLGIPVFAQEQEGSLDLGPLYEPDPVTFSFNAPGWYFLLLVLVAFVLFFGYQSIRKYIKNAYRRAALKYLRTIRSRFEELQDGACLNDVIILLKQVAIRTFGRDEVAELHGENWLVFLESKCKRVSFIHFQELISKSLYQEQLITKSEFSDLYEVSKKWIRYHA